MVIGVNHRKGADTVNTRYEKLLGPRTINCVRSLLERIKAIEINHCFCLITAYVFFLFT